MQDIDVSPDLGRALDESYGHGPPHRPLEPVLRAGRRIRRRRQVLKASAGVGAAAVLFVVTTLAWGPLGGSDVEVVARPSAPVSPAVTSGPTAEPGLPAEPAVAFDRDELLRAQPPAVIVAQTADVELGRRFAGPDDRSAAAEVRWQGERWYVLARQVDRGPAEYIAVEATGSTPTLADFLAEAKDRYAEGTGLR